MGKSLENFLNELSGKKCVVVGMGVSNIPLIRMLLQNGASVLVCDEKEEHDAELVREFESLGAKFSFGKKYLSSVGVPDVIFKTPGIRFDEPELQAAEKNGARLTSEMEQFLKLRSCRCIGVTGSDGKTTTTTIIGKLLERAGSRVFVGGNIGNPLLPEVDEMKPSDFAIVELSSFQLLNIKAYPDIAVITNITPNHLDKHKSYGEYIEAKKEIYAGATGKVVLNFDNDETRRIAEEIPNRAVLFSSKKILKDGFCVEGGYIVRKKEGKTEKILSLSDIQIPGMHNVENYMAAIAACEGLVTTQDIVSVAKSFKGVEHRIEFVREISGVRYYNDSIASSPTRTIAGLRAFDQKVILIAGGYNKKIPFDVLGDAVVEHVKALVLVGATSDLIRKAVVDAEGYDEKKLPIIMCASFEDAVSSAAKIAERGDVVTLSPACAAFDLFKNFMVRGKRFKELVNSL